MNRIWGILAMGILLSLSLISGAQAQQVNTFCSSTATPPYVWTPCPGSGGGGGLSVAYAGPIGANGTPGGFKDGSGNFQPFTGAAGNLNVNIAAGGLTGSTSNATSAQATTTTNLPNVSYNYGFNGTTWDQLQVSGTKNLYIDTPTTSNNLYAALIAASPALPATTATTNTYTNNVASPINMDLNGGLYVDCGQFCLTLGPAVPTSSLPTVSAGYTYDHIAAGSAATFVVKASAGVLHSITFNSAATATNVTTVYDNASGSGTVIAIPAATTATIAGLTLTYDVAFANGLTIITTTANGADMTVSYR